MSESIVQCGETSFIHLIQERRSHRTGFNGKPVSPDAVAAIIRCGMAAPSSKNAQLWRFHVVPQGECLAGIADTVEHAKNHRYRPIDPATGTPRLWASTVVESAQVLREVGVGIFVENRGPFSGGYRFVARADERFRDSAVIGYGLEMAGIGAAVTNMLLAAKVLGLEGVFMADVAVAEVDISRRLGIQRDLVCAVALGSDDQSLVAPKHIEEGLVVYHDGEG